MSFRFRRSVRIIPGVRLNLSKSGISVSVGGPGATLNLSSRGSAVTLGLPGTGLSYRHRLSLPKGRAPHNVAPPQAMASPIPSAEFAAPDLPPAPAPQEPFAGEIRSAEVVVLTSPDLAGLKALINEAASQKRSLDADLDSALADRTEAWVKLRRREQLPLRPFYRKRLPAFRTAYDEAEGEALKVIEAMALSEVRVRFEFDAPTLAAQQALEAAHGRLSRCANVWDVTSLNAVDRYSTRSLASSAVTRTPVRLTSVTDGVIAGKQAGLRFQNANGADLDFFPGFLLMRTRSTDDYALIDLRESRSTCVRSSSSKRTPYRATRRSSDRPGQNRTRTGRPTGVSSTTVRSRSCAMAGSPLPRPGDWLKRTRPAIGSRLLHSAMPFGRRSRSCARKARDQAQLRLRPPRRRRRSISTSGYRPCPRYPALTASRWVPLPP